MRTLICGINTCRSTDRSTRPDTARRRPCSRGKSAQGTDVVARDFQGDGLLIFLGTFLFPSVSSHACRNTFLIKLRSFSDAEAGELTGCKVATNCAAAGNRDELVLSCIGFGDELVAEEPRNGLWNHYAGPRFWHDSDGILANRALPHGVSDVVISGGGDGAMQDLQRVATNGTLFGRELYVKLQGLIDHQVNRGWIAKPFPDTDSLMKFLSAEETGRRAFSWAPDRYGVPLAMKQWHDAFAEPVFAAVRSWPTSGCDWICEQVFRKELIERNLELTWVMHDPTSGYAYEMNCYKRPEVFGGSPSRLRSVSESRRIKSGEHFCVMACSFYTARARHSNARASQGRLKSECSA